MNTATPRIRAGAPAPIQTRRVEPSMLGTPAPLGLMKYEATEFAGPEPDDEDGPPEMLAFAIVLALACVICGVFIAGVLS